MTTGQSNLRPARRRVRQHVTTALLGSVCLVCLLLYAKKSTPDPYATFFAAADVAPESVRRSQELSQGVAHDLLRRIGDRRFIYLAEPDHYISEKYDFLLAFIKALRARGFEHIGFELGLTDGLLLDKYLQSGDEAYLDRMWALGYRGGDIRLGTATVRPAMFHIKTTQWLVPLHEERRWFYRQLRALTMSDGIPLRVFGFDMQMIDPEAVYPYLYDLLGGCQPTALIDALRENLARIAGQDLKDEIERLNFVKDLVVREAMTLQMAFPDATFTEFTVVLDFLIQSFEAHLSAQRANDPLQVYRWLKERETKMILRMQQVLASLPDDAKIILSGHIMHLSKNDSELWFPSAEKPRAKQIWWTLGTEIARSYQEQVYGIWMLYNRGAHSDPSCPLASCPVVAVSNTLEQRFTSRFAEGLLFLPLPALSGERDQEHRFKVSGTTVLKGRLTGQVDALYIFDQVREPAPRM